MSGVIIGSQKAAHSVNKYNFKNLDLFDDEDEFQEGLFVDSDSHAEPTSFMHIEEEVDSSAMSASSKDSLIESLLKKTDEMSSNFIKLQMKLEDMSQEHKLELEKVKKEAFEEGRNAGRADGAADDERKFNGATEQLFDSISKLQNSAALYESALEGIKKELVGAAVDIAKEVVKVELGENSSSIALLLSNELIAQLQRASKITLKVNPKDHGVISQNIGELANITIVSDGAVAQGGVIAISDVGNIDAQVFKRFERVKRAALGE